MGNKQGKKAKGGDDQQKNTPAASKDNIAASESQDPVEPADEKQNDEVGELPKFDDVPEKFKKKNRRVSVSAEVDSDPNEKYEPRVVPKSEATVARIEAAIKNIFLFASLDDDQRKTIIDAMEEKKVSPGDTIIQQGAPGDYFYIIESGLYEVWKKVGMDPAAKVFQYNGAGSFGELALMYNAPRAATVKAATEGILYVVDRVTFRHIIITATSQQKKRYEAFIEKVPLFEKLTARERSLVADCMVAQNYKLNEYVIRQGEAGDAFYVVEKGEAVATQIVDGSEIEVGRMREGQYFGERALITNEPRAANVKAGSEELRVAAMDRSAFERLLGDCKDIMHRKIASYQSATELLGARRQSQEQLNKADDDKDDEKSDAREDSAAPDDDNSAVAEHAVENNEPAESDEAELRNKQQSPHSGQGGERDEEAQ